MKQKGQKVWWESPFDFLLFLCYSKEDDWHSMRESANKKKFIPDRSRGRACGTIEKG
ncbi:hypothetical protein [uncultured Selenomonas sp.]|uniref:hypothetical protein n=1 Tax=uncultured Selenomonas sp. TaxID=159275 RepID=UPI002805FFD5|nr:hypothetical protein [uncultured Selenomonas sp.]